MTRGHQVAGSIMRVLMVTKDGAIIHVNTLDIFEIEHVLERHLELLLLEQEIWAGRSNALGMWRWCRG